MGRRTKRRRRRRTSGRRIAVVALAIAGVMAAFALARRSLPEPSLAPPRYRTPTYAQPAPDALPAADRGPLEAGARGVVVEPEPAAARDAGGTAVDPSDATARDVADAPGPGNEPRDRRPRLAIVIDDLGDSLDRARAVLALEPAVTVAVIPFLAASAAVATEAVERGREVILHLPLEPHSADAMGRARGFLRVEMSAADFDRQLEADLRAVPYIVGVNGHMGSRFTGDLVAMEHLLGALHQRGLFFLDSRTTGDSVAAPLAARIGVKFAERSVFLDHERTPAAIRARLEEIEATVRRRGEAIAIGHPYPETLAVLGPWLRRAERSGIAIVPASKLVR